MDTPSALSQELVDAIRNRLDTGHFKEALELPNDNKYAAALKDNCWDLIPQLINRIEDDTIIKWPAMLRCCERLLLIVAERANPEEVLLELIEQSEIADNDAKFISLLKPMQAALKRVDKKKNRSLEWCLNTINIYLDKLPTPEDRDFDEIEKLAMDCDEDNRRILKIYAELPSFYEYYVDQVSNNTASSIRNIVTCFLVGLFGKPFSFIDFEFDGKTKSPGRVFAERLFKDLCLVHKDLFEFLEYAQVKCHPPVKRRKCGVYEEAPTDIFLLSENLTALSLGTLYYLLLTERLSAPLLPQVYAPMYIFQECLGLSVHLLKQKETMVQYKGVLLGGTLVNILPADSSSLLLRSPENHAFTRTLSRVAVYSVAETVRRQAVSVLRNYIFKFEDKARHSIIMRLYPVLDHSGMKGFVINIYKDVLLQGFTTEVRLNYFKDRMPEIIKMFCKLSHGTETDLVESADHLISVLNFLRFLILRDSTNYSGIWDYVKDLQDGFLAELREGLNMSQAHYEGKLMDLSKKEEKVKFNVSIGDAPLNLPVRNKREVINSGINALHLLNSLLCRLEECIEANKSH